MTRRDDRGASSVEFALVVPLFFALIAMAGYFAWHVYAEAQLERAAQRAARYAAVPTTEGAYAYERCAVVALVNDQVSGFDVPAAAVAVSDRSGALPVTACPGGAATPGRPTGWVRVRVTHTLDNPFSNALELLLDRPHALVITGSGEARVEDPT